METTLPAQPPLLARIVSTFSDPSADVHSMENFSAHGDYKEMLQYLSCQDASKVKGMWLVHGDQDSMGVWKSHLLNAGFRNVEIAQHWSTVELQ